MLYSLLPTPIPTTMFHSKEIIGDSLRPKTTRKARLVVIYRISVEVGDALHLLNEGDSSHLRYLSNNWESLKSDCTIGKYSSFPIKSSQVT